MNRAIKFRAWVNVPNANTMLHNIDLEDLWMSGRAYEDYGTSRFEAETISGISWTFKNLIFMQLTGILDKNGREIYQGDIVSVEGIGNAEVAMEDGQWMTYREDYPEVCGSLYGWLCPLQVVGNIYEHPELLRKGQP